MFINEVCCAMDVKAGDYILVATSSGNLTAETVIGVSEYDGFVTIRTEWEFKGCEKGISEYPHEPYDYVRIVTLKG